MHAEKLMLKLETGAIQTQIMCVQITVYWCLASCSWPFLGCGADLTVPMHARELANVTTTHHRGDSRSL